MARVLVLVLTLLVTLDLSMPSVPGALTFDPEQCVDAAARPGGAEIDHFAATLATVTSRAPLVTSDSKPTRAPVADGSGKPRPRRQQALVADAGSSFPTDH